MKLAQYMELKSLSPEKLANELGCSQGAIRKWLSGERTPRHEQMCKIAEATAGAVTPNDFFEVAA